MIPKCHLDSYAFIRFFPNSAVYTLMENMPQLHSYRDECNHCTCTDYVARWPGFLQCLLAASEAGLALLAHISTSDKTQSSLGARREGY